MKTRLQTYDELLAASDRLSDEAITLVQAIERDRSSAELYYRVCHLLELAVLLHNADFDHARK